MKAVDDVAVQAKASEDVLLVGAGVARATSGRGAVSALVVNNTTEARMGGNVTAGGNALVTAHDGTVVVAVDGAGGFGLGGAGASVGVIDLNKTTRAYVADGAAVNARGGGGGFDALTGVAGGDAGTGFSSAEAHGLAVQADSSEEIYHIAVALGGGFVGLAGGILVTTVDSGTEAYIGAASVNQDNNDVLGQPGQDVAVTAANKVDIVSFAGGIGVGAAGVAGAVDVGTVRNNVNAQIKGGANVRARDDVSVDALGIKDIDGIAGSAAAGAVGLAGSVSVWTVGEAVNRNYQGDGGPSANALEGEGGKTADADAGGQAQQGSNDLVDALDNTDTGAHDPNTASNSQDRVSAGIWRALNGPTGTGGFNAAKPTSGSVTGSLTGPAVGTTASIGAATVDAGGDIDVDAVENVHLTMTQGGVAGGLAGIGAGIGVLTLASNVSATAGGTLSAGDDIDIHASLYEHVDNLAFAGGAGFVGLGAAVSVVNDKSTVTAGLSNNAVVHKADLVDIDANGKQVFDVLTVGVAIGAIGAGASFAKVNVDNGAATEVLAFVGNGVQIGQSAGDAVQDLTVEAKSDIDVAGEAFGLAGGIGAFSANFAYATVTPEVVAKVGDGASGAAIKLGGDMLVKSTGWADLDTTTTGANIGAIAGGASISKSDLRPEIRSSVVKGTVVADNLTVQANSNAGAPGTLDVRATAFTASGGVAAASGASTTAIHSPTLESRVGSAADVNVSGTITLDATGNQVAKAKSGGVAGGLGGVGASFATATTSGSLSAHFDGEVKNGSAAARRP